MKAKNAFVPDITTKPLQGATENGTQITVSQKIDLAVKLGIIGPQLHVTVRELQQVRQKMCATHRSKQNLFLLIKKTGSYEIVNNSAQFKYYLHIHIRKMDLTEQCPP